MSFSYFRRTGKGVAKAWRRQYCSSTPPGGDYWPYEKNRAVYESLLALGADPDPDRIDAIIGNGSWTRLVCNNHTENRYVDEAVIIDAPYRHMVLCLECFDALVAFAAEERKGKNKR